MKYGYKLAEYIYPPRLISSEHVTGDSFWATIENGCPKDMIGRSAYRVHDTPEAALEFVLASLERQARDIQAHADSVRSHIAALKAGISAEDFYMAQYNKNRA